MGGAGHSAHDYGDQRYGGVCPPGGSTHRHIFKSNALHKADLPREMAGSVPGRGQLKGTYRLP